MRSDRRTGGGPGASPSRALLVALVAGIFLLIGDPALAQTGYTGVGLPPPPDTYVAPIADLYAGLGASPGEAVPFPAPTPRPSGEVITVSTERLGDPLLALDQGRQGLFTGWDLVALAALGLTAAAGFAVAVGRSRSAL